MNFIQKLKLIERIDSLISRKSTGTPLMLSQRVGVSERTLYNILGIMKKLGAPIFYCSSRNSYCYTSEVTFSYTFKIEENPAELTDVKEVFNMPFKTTADAEEKVVDSDFSRESTVDSAKETTSDPNIMYPRSTVPINQRSEIIDSIMRYRETKIS